MLLLRLIKPEGSLQQESYTCNLGKRKKKKKERRGKGKYKTVFQGRTLTSWCVPLLSTPELWKHEKMD